MKQEIGFDTYTLPCVKERAGGKLLHSTGNSALCLREDLEGWDGAGGREVQEWGVHVHL